jgi:integrase
MELSPSIRFSTRQSHFRAFHQARKAATVNGTTVEAVGRDWFERRRHADTPAGGKSRLPDCRESPLRDAAAISPSCVTSKIVLGVIREIEARGAETVARRVRQRMSRIFVHAIACGIGESDPAAPIQKALTERETRPQPAITNLAKLRAMLRDLEAQVVYPVTKLAMRFLALTASRPKEVRYAVWEEFEDLNGAEPVWRIPPARMKGKREHVVALPAAAVDVLKAARIMSYYSPFVFPNKSDLNKPMSRNLLSQLLRDTGYKNRHVPHGFRSSFSTIMNDRRPEVPNIVEAALSHEIPGVPGIYNRGKYLAHRRELMEEWADLILDGAPDAETLLLGKRKSHPSSSNVSNVIVLSKRRRPAA